MKKFPVIIIILSAIFTLCVSTSPHHEDLTTRDSKYVYWDDRPIIWDDFKGKVPSSSPYEAITWSAIRFSYGGIGADLQVTVESIFDPQQSWKKKNVTEYVLSHEQRHFDITEVHARMLRKEISEVKFKTYESLDDEIGKMFSQNFENCEKMQDEYDEQTDHSKNQESQQKWNQKIDHILDSLKSWSGTEYKIDIGYLIKE